MSKRGRFLLIALSLCLSIIITGCGLQDLLGKKNKTSSTSNGGGESKTVIAVSLNEEDPNKLLIIKGIDDMAKKESVEIKYMEPTEKGKEKESPLKGAKLLIFQGGNETLLKSAETEKIPILALGKLPSDIKLEGIITSNQGKAGEIMAQTILSKVTEGQIVILQGDPSESGSQERLAGNKAVFSKHPQIKTHTIVSTPGSEAVAKLALAEFLVKNPDKVQGVLAHTEKLASQASEVLKQAQLDKKIILVGGQASVSSLERMSIGAQVGDIDTSPYLQGVNAYQWAQKIIKKESLDVNDTITSEQGEIPAKIIEVKAVTTDNIALIQKSYTLTMKSAEQDKKEKEEKKKEETKASKGDKASEEGKDQGASKKEESQAGDKQESQGGDKQESPIPAGVKKVTERIKTETTREYLDSEGKVMGTEKTVNEQVKTVPPEMLKQQAEQAKDEKKGQEGEKEKDKEKDK